MKYKLGEICEIVSGSTPKTTISEYWDGDVKWITPAEISDETYIIDDSVRHITELGAKKTGLTPFPKGTVILSSRAPIGKVAIAGCEMYCNQGFKNLICSEKINNRYLYWFLKGNTDFLNSLGRGATFKEISKQIVSSIEINVPDLKVQEEAVRILETTTHIIQTRRKQLQALDDLIKARFVEMFGDPLQETQKWGIQSIGDVAESVDPQPSHRTPPVDEAGVPYVSIKDCNYKTGIIDFEGARKVGLDVLEEHRSRYKLKDGDMIIGKIGTIGNPIFVPAKDDYTLSANVVLIQPYIDKVSPYYLRYSLMSTFVERQFDEAKNSTSQAAFGIQKIRTVKIMNPDLAVQYVFESFVRQVEKSKVAVQKALDETQKLFDSLMQEYFG